MTPSIFTWRAAGTPAIGLDLASTSGRCATCAAEIDRGVPVGEIETPTFADHAQFLRFGTHVCIACAWLYTIGKGRPGNYLAVEGALRFAVLSHDSVVEDKPTWLEVMTGFASASPDALAVGVLTTDVKPRLWPRARLVTRARFGLYVHAPDYDVSDFVEFSLDEALAIVAAMRPPLAAGYAKASVYHGLLRDHARASRMPAEALEYEAALRPMRRSPAFVPALLVAGLSKKEKQDVKAERSYGGAGAAAASGDRDGPAQPGLF